MNLFATPAGGAPARDRASEPSARSRLALRGFAGEQNWVLTPFQDSLLIIAAPLLVLGVALAMFGVFGATQATAYILLAHVVMTVAHHLPTFIRIYGDVELFRRFRRSFILAPTVSLAFAASVLGYINYKDYPLEYFFYIYIMLALWDPWHFLRQHYGFMRIYDRQNEAPKRLAARMDLWLCLTWFAYILLASGDWLPGVLEDLQRHAHINTLLSIPIGFLPRIAELMRDLAIAMTVAYAGYLVWCWRRGYFISGAKLALFAITFGVMYVAYTPNAVILGAAPEWTFKVGFAVLGIVHMTQYLAIVWRYNRSLTRREGRARQGFFHRFHARGTWLTVVVYVVVCLAYGSSLTTVHEERWLMSVLLAVGFTSTLMHYYFDGYIWKVRHVENREALALDSTLSATAAARPGEASGAPLAVRFGKVPAASAGREFDEAFAGGDASRRLADAGSWWSRRSVTSHWPVFLRQVLFFGVPAAVLTIGATSMWATDKLTYIDHMYNALALDRDSRPTAAASEASLAYEAMTRQLPIAKKLAELQPTASREAALAYLLFNHARYENLVMPALHGEAPSATQRAAELSGTNAAIAAMERALRGKGPIDHEGRDQLTREDAERTLASWRAKAAQLEQLELMRQSELGRHPS